MQPQHLIVRISAHLDSKPFDTQAYEDLFSAIRLLGEQQMPEALAQSQALRKRADAILRFAEPQTTLALVDIIKRAYLFEAPHIFDSYCLALEWNRPPEKRFYQPRREVLYALAQDLQDLADRKIEFLGVSMPPRTGKSSTCIFFLSWLMGKYPDAANVMSGHSDKLTDSFYAEVLSIITDTETYCWNDIFPTVKLADKSAKNETIDLNKKKRFPTLTCRSIGGTLTGAVEVSEDGLLYSDDLVEDLEESLNIDRLNAKYDAYLNQLKDRKKMGALELMVGTRWNVFDPLGRIEEQYRDDPKYRFRVIPALDVNDHSNFNYQYGLGFDDAYYTDMRNSIDPATWAAKYMGSPYIREGLLFPEKELRRYNGVLPDGKPDRITGVVDVAWGGGDSLSMPIAYVYDGAVYIHDWVFNKGDKTATRPVVCGTIKRHGLHKIRFEADNGGHEYADIVDGKLREDGVRISTTAIKAPSTQGKLSRIIQMSPEIKHFYFLDNAHASAEYKAALRELTTFVQTGKNKHDDAPDSLAMLADELQGAGIARCTPIKRPY